MVVELILFVDSDRRLFPEKVLSRRSHSRYTLWVSDSLNVRSLKNETHLWTVCRNWFPVGKCERLNANFNDQKLEHQESFLRNGISVKLFHRKFLDVPKSLDALVLRAPECRKSSNKASSKAFQDRAIVCKSLLWTKFKYFYFRTVQI